MSTISSLQPPAWLPHTARSYTRISQLWQVPAFLLGIAAMTAVFVGLVLQQGQEQQLVEAEIQQLRTLLTAPDVDMKALRPRLNQLLNQAGIPAQKAGEIHLLTATVLLGDADRSGPSEGRLLLQEALMHLEEANILGVVPEDRPRVWYQLGKTLFRTGGDINQVIGYLQRALPRGADDPAAGYAMLVQAYLRLPTPDLDAALEANRLQLNATKDVNKQLAAYLLRGELLVRKKQYFDALGVLKRIEPDAPPELRRKSIYLQAIACEAEALWSQAVSLWQELLQAPEHVPGGKQRILFTLGHCYFKAAPPDERRAIEMWKQAQEEGGLEGQAAGLRLGYVYLFGEQPNSDQAVRHVAQALHEVETAGDYNNPLIPLEEVREMLALGIRTTTETQAFSQAQELAGLYAKLTSPEKAELLLADIAESWADLLDQQARATQRPHAEQLRHKAASQRHKAAQVYHQAAQRHTGDKKADLLRRSADNYTQAGDFQGARDVLQQYVALALPSAQLAEGWYALAAAQEALGQKNEARQSYYKCIEYPNSACVYKARYRLALDRIEQKQYDQAETILRENIPITSASVDREAHEKSLYRLAMLLYERQKYSEAYFYLERAARDYPAHADVYRARDLLAACYHRFARQENKKLHSLVNPLPQQKQDILQKKQDWQEKAIAVYQKLADDLELKKENRRSAEHEPSLSPLEEGLLGKAAFAIGDIKFEMNLFTEALRRYEILAKRHRGQVEELLAGKRLWLCVAALKYQPKELQKAADAVQAALPSVKETLSRLPDETIQRTGKTRQQWQQYFEAVEKQLPQVFTSIEQPEPPTPPSPAPRAETSEPPTASPELPPPPASSTNLPLPPSS